MLISPGGARRTLLPPAAPRTDARTQVQDAIGATSARAGTLERGADATRGQALQAFTDFNPEQYLSDGALQSLFARAGVGQRQEMGNLRATNERRGIHGPLAGATEGDLASAHERNLLATTADFADKRANLALDRARGISGRADSDTELAFNTRGQGLELLMGQADREQAAENAKRQEAAAKRRGLGAGIGALVGGAGGFFAGGPMGAAAGAQIGSQAGAGFFG